MGLVTLLAVSLLGTSPPDGGAEAAGATSPGSESPAVGGLVVDTTAVSPGLRVRHGALDPDTVRQVVTAQRDALRSCYERALGEDPRLSGAFTVRIVLDRDGTVGLASMQGSSLHSLSMQRCVLQLARTWRFPPPADGRPAAIEYPLAFRREAPDAGP
jgi:TonB family protein